METETLVYCCYRGFITGFTATDEPVFGGREKAMLFDTDSAAALVEDLDDHQNPSLFLRNVKQ